MKVSPISESTPSVKKVSPIIVIAAERKRCNPEHKQSKETPLPSCFLFFTMEPAREVILGGAFYVEANGEPS